MPEVELPRGSIAVIDTAAQKTYLSLPTLSSVSLSRRDALRLGAGAALVGLAGCTTTVERRDTYRERTDWPMATHDAANTNHQPGTGGPTDQPEIVWTVDVRPTERSDPPSSEWRATSPPMAVVSDGTVYVGGEGLFAIDATDGSIRWRVHEDEMVFAPAVVDETIFAGCRDDDQTGAVRAFSAGGEQQWTTPYDRDLRCLRFGPLLAAGDRVYVPIGENEDANWPPDRGPLLALDAETGDQIWAIETARQMDRAAPPAVVDGTVYVGGPDNSHLQAIGPDCDLSCQFLGGHPTRRWTSDSPWFYPLTAPVVTDDLVFAAEWGHHWKAHSGSSYNVLSAFSRANGTRRWTREVGEQLTSPALADGSLFVAATRSTGTEPYESADAVRIATDVEVVSYETGGEERWHRSFAERRVWADPIVAGDVAYLATNPSQTTDAPSTLHALDGRTGSTRWERSLPMRTSALALADGRLYASGWDGTVVALA